MHHLGKNIAALFVLQVSVYLIPLITTPYLARTLEVANFGLLGVASAIVSYVSMLSDWGFAFTATRETARHAGDSRRSSQNFVGYYSRQGFTLRHWSHNFSVNYLDPYHNGAGW